MEFTKRFHQFGSFASNIVNNTKNVQMPQNPGQVFCIGAGLLGTVVIKVTKKKEKKFVHPHEEYEHALERMKSAESRIEAVSSLLKEMTEECNETKEELSIVVSQKNAIERMLEELEKAKEQAEKASRDLQRSVNVLTSELETNKERHVEKVKQWRNEIVSYREKTHENFLAEVIGLVSDMDNDIEIEVVPHSMLPHERAEVHLKEGENEWEYNPRFALEDSARLSILANCGKSAKEVKQVKAEKILSHATKKVESPTHVKKVATPTRKAFARITNNQVTQNITEKIMTKTMKPKPPPTKKSMLSSLDAEISNKEFGEMLYFDFENNNAKSAADSKSSVGKLAGAKAKFMAKWNSSKAGAVAETAFGVSDVKRAFKINGQVEKIEYISPSRRDLSVVR